MSRICAGGEANENWLKIDKRRRARGFFFVNVKEATIISITSLAMTQLLLLLQARMIQ